ncbi:MAG: DNA repair protein RecN [Gammaproteobacteria bacterium]
MLLHLHIRNLAVVDEVELELATGLTTLTGETGAGKSIMVDALSLVLGERADSDAVRPGAQRAEISATFTLESASPAAQWLNANDLDSDADAQPADPQECILRRVVTAEGRSRGYINGNSVAMQTLRELGSMLVDICGQQSHLSLGKPEMQRALLDRHGNNLALVARHREAHQHWQQVKRRYDELRATSSEQASRMDLLSFQVQELEALDAQPDEITNLEQAHRLAANVSRIAESTGAALQMLYENEQASAYDLTSRARALLDDLSDLDPELADLARMLSDAEIQITEAADSLRHYLDKDQGETGDLAQLEARLAAMHDMARKHRVRPEKLAELTARLREDLRQIENFDDTLAELQRELDASVAALKDAGSKLTAARKKSARSLAKRVTENIRGLGMPDGEFSVQITPLDTPAAHGSDRVEFLVALNPGLPPGPLNRVASGGELSRVSLAINVGCNDSDTPTLIFDEVDAGIGGKTADMVGEQLRKLAAMSQVLCVTHLPQVASKGHQQFRVSKLSDGKSTRTRVMQLTEDERVEELARMLGGAEITDRTRDHAAEMLATGNG